MAAGAHAAAFTNGSFEGPGGAPIKQELSEGDTFLTGWVSHGAGNYYESDGQDGITAADGSHWVGFGHNGATGSTLSQTFATFVGAFYTLSYDFRLQQGDEAGSGFQLSASTGDSVFSGDASLATWVSGPVLTFTGTGGDVTLTIKDVTTSGGISNLALDNLRLSVTGGPDAVPEPTAWAMMILGFGGVGGLMRRRRGLAA
ncbi:MAG TPA: PEPxxWA-CTERM sorting domain-containing protein [Phenylobacterium sp.]